MRERYDLEYPDPVEEISPPGAEFPTPGAEFSVPVEFHRAAADDGAGERKKPKKRLLSLAAAFLTVAALTLPGNSSSPSPAPTTEPSPAPTTEPSPIPTEELPEPGIYPLSSGTLEILVYSGVYDPENNWNEGILYQGSFPENEFTELALPEMKPMEGFVFMGYVMLSTGQDRLLGNTLTAEDAELNAPGKDGIRRLEIHGAWRSEESAKPWMPLTLDANGGSPLTKYDATGPLASAGTVYTCAYPIPERSGYRFAGWYATPDCSGNPVKRIPADDFFEADAEGIHWDRSTPITLYARWIAG